MPRAGELYVLSVILIHLAITLLYAYKYDFTTSSFYIFFLMFSLLLMGFYLVKRAGKIREIERKRRRDFYRNR